MGSITLGISQLIAMVDPHDVASIRVADKVGMTYDEDVIFEGYSTRITGTPSHAGVDWCQVNDLRAGC